MRCYSIQAVFLFVLLAGMVPLLLGVLLELLILPIRVPPNKSPVLFLYQDWVLGLLCLKLWHRAVMVGQGAGEVQPDANPAVAGRDEGFLAEARMGWREKFLKLHRSGFNEDTMLFLWTAIATPLLLHVTTALAVPYALSRAVLPSLKLAPLWLLPYLQLYSYHITAATIGASIMLLRFKTWAMKLHNSIRDDR
jgi:E3 ubiquitin-protein ligase MARCH6